ncbi:ABC transporter permease [Modestobacter versicolor]|uniref:ABC transporter permease n=1 Tax=Modestobacter versicolor TaxID=429133 RepID=UPI0034DE1DA3
MRTVMGEVWQFRGLIGNFAQRELKSKYKGSVVGWAWSLINPLVTLGIYTLVFGVFLGANPPEMGNGMKVFALYLFTGLVIWNFINQVVQGSMIALTSNGPLLRKIYFPAFAPVAGNIVALALQTAIELGLLLFVFAVLGNLYWTVLWLPVVLLLVIAFAVGAGFYLAALNARFRDVSYLVQVTLNLVFYATPIIYPISLVEQYYDRHAWARIYELNPVTQLVELMREILYTNEAPSPTRFAYAAVVSLVVLATGWTFFQRRSRDLSEVL